MEIKGYLKAIDILVELAVSVCIYLSTSISLHESKSFIIRNVCYA